MARIPEQFTGDLCSHGVPKEFGGQCAECQTEDKPLVETSGVRPKINLNEDEIDKLLSRIEKGEFENDGELIQFKVEKSDQEQPVAVLEEEEEEVPAQETKEEKLDRILQSQAKKVALEVVDAYAKAIPPRYSKFRKDPDKGNRARQVSEVINDVKVPLKKFGKGVKKLPGGARQRAFLHLNEEIDTYVDNLYKKGKISITRADDIRANMVNAIRTTIFEELRAS